MFYAVYKGSNSFKELSLRYELTSKYKANILEVFQKILLTTVYSKLCVEITFYLVTSHPFGTPFINFTVLRLFL